MQYAMQAVDEEKLQGAFARVFNRLIYYKEAFIQRILEKKNVFNE